MTSYRLSTTEDQEQFYNLYLYAFGNQDSAARRAFFKPRYEHALTYGIKDGDQLVSGLYSLPFRVNFHGQQYHMNGIGDVMSAPEFSGRGGASTLMRAALTDMYAAGVELSYLAPFSYEYYRRFGYEQVFEHTEYRIASRDLPHFRASDEGGSLVRGKLADLYQDLKPLNARSNRTQRGGVMRADWWWDYLCLKNNWDAAIYRDATGMPTGYVIYAREGTQLTVKEYVAETAIARQQLLGFIMKHGNTFAELVYEAPDTDFMQDYLPNPYVLQTTVQPYMMARIVHLERFMSKYPVSEDAHADLVFKLTDETVPANDGYWYLRVADGKLALTKTDETAAAAQLSIQQFSKLMMGAQSASELAARGQITATPAQAAELDSVRVKQSPSLVDYF